jgi:hypothetical protein
VQALVVAPAIQHPAGELVDDEDLTVADDVVLVLGEQLLDLERIVEVADQRRVGRLERFSMPNWSSTRATPSSETPTVRLRSSTS